MELHLHTHIYIYRFNVYAPEDVNVLFRNGVGIIYFLKYMKRRVIYIIMCPWFFPLARRKAIGHDGFNLPTMQVDSE